MKSLHAQINPHFLYNSLYVLYRIIQGGDQERAGILTNRLSQYYQYITRETSLIIPLQKEVEHAQTFTEIQSIRTGARISVRWTEPPQGISTIPVPRLTLQPIIENCYKHGLKNKIDQGRINISYDSWPDAVWIYVEDNGDEIDAERINQLNQYVSHFRGDTDGEMTALQNIHRRIQIHCNRSLDKCNAGTGVGGGDQSLNGLNVRDSVHAGKSGLVFQQGPDHGLRVIIKIPFGVKNVSRNDRG